MLRKIDKLNILLILTYMNLIISLLQYLPFVIGIHFEKNIIPSALSESDIISIISEIVKFFLTIIIIVNIIIAIMYYREKNSENANKNMKKIKLYLIPYWVINFVLGIATTLTTAFMGGIFFGLAFLVTSYLFLVTTSCYSLAYLGILLKNKQISIVHFFFHMILQLCFVMDIIDTVYLLYKYKHNDA